MLFRIYYDDGSTWDDDVENAPGQGVLAVVKPDPEVGHELLHRQDFYIWEFDQWLGVDTYGLYDYLARPGWKKVLAGRTVTAGRYSEVFAQAASEGPKLFGPKSALQVDEEPLQ